MNGTRVVFPERERDVTMRVENTSDQPVLSQSWIDDGRVDVPPEQLQVPFVVAPSLKRVEPGRSTVLRITHTPMPTPLPGDRESIYWLNVLEVPASQKDLDNQLRFGFRTRIKLFFRPTALADGVDAAPDQLVWKAVAHASDTGTREVVLEVANPTPYYVSFGRVEGDPGGTFVSAGGGMVAPFGSARFVLPGNAASARKPATVRYMVIDDYGGRTTITKKLAD
ncbi:fimbria/pilus periplasmic chaperone [Burkholderia sp. 4701]|nr:fimbria/pilus periplasmic chaperone [Burkholderia sp. 4701]MXN81113.1 fimbria/pilus periplasmic chaperone [Burkholderia sp. 4812]